VILKVAVGAPLRRLFDYLPPRNQPLPPVGGRVCVPFGRRQVTGIVCEVVESSDLPLERLKPVVHVLDAEAFLPATELSLLRWSAEYYHHPVGDVILGMLPPLLREGRPAKAEVERCWQLTARGQALAPDQFKRAPLQRRLWQALKEAPAYQICARDLDKLSDGAGAALVRMRERGWVDALDKVVVEEQAERAIPGPPLNPAQLNAAQSITGHLGRFSAFLLHGITGSGKTEVYLYVIEQVLARGQQVLVLVPEIALTPQLLARFCQRLGVPIAVLHSARSESERANAWIAARDGRAAVVIGTRSAVFVPLARPGLIVIDEEHDPSYKQQDGFRYHARDVAIMRASRAQIPIVLGSATPSLESFQQVLQERYQLLELPLRAAAAQLPSVRVIDMRRQSAHEGLSPALRVALAARLAASEQSLLFLNRRGYAPVWMCHDCGWVAACERCDANLVLHHGAGQLRCHHCGAERQVVTTCPRCESANLHVVGEGTERIESTIAKYFPTATIVRIDRDTTRRRGALEQKLELARSGAADILIGTQMLSKGHDFPNVTLVGVLNADQGLYGVDFRADERLFQLLMQVSGRAGRADKPGEVLIQTWHPEHPLFAALAAHDYARFAQATLPQRQETGYPPFSYLAMLRAESPYRSVPLQFLNRARVLAVELPEIKGVELMDPVPAPMPRRAGRYRVQMLLQATKRPALHRFIDAWLGRIEALPETRRVRWSLDVDPVDLY